MAKYFENDLLASDCDYICHQVNCQGRMGSGVAKQVKDKWPKVFTLYNQQIYRAYQTDEGFTWNLGTIQIVNVGEDNPKVINMFAQENYGYDGKRYTDYGAFLSCLMEIAETVPKDSRVGFPVGIGCGLGGGDWKIIEGLIILILDDDYSVEFYHHKV